MSKLNVELNELARKMVGDGKKPDLFFVGCRNGREYDCGMVTSHFDEAYCFWKKLATISKSSEPMLENRTWGVIASVESDEVTGQYILWDDSIDFLRNRAICATLIS